MTTNTFPVPGPIAVHLRIAHGGVTVDAVEDLTEAVVTVTARHAGSDVVERIVVDYSNETLVVRAPREGGIFDLPILGRRAGDEVDVRLRIPAGSAVQLSTFTAPITVRGRCGDADVAFASGGAAFEHIDGDLRARYGSGQVRAVRISGRAKLRSGAGDVKLGDVSGPVTAGCGTGSVEVQVARGSVRSRTGAGSARLGAVHGDVDIVSGSGSVHIGVPRGLTVRLDVTSGSGDVVSDLPIEQTPRNTDATPITLRARTGSGRVRLFRAA